jgi:hypothetical protein
MLSYACTTFLCAHTTCGFDTRSREQLGCHGRSLAESSSVSAPRLKSEPTRILRASLAERRIRGIATFFSPYTTHVCHTVKMVSIRRRNVAIIHKDIAAISQLIAVG